MRALTAARRYINTPLTHAPRSTETGADVHARIARGGDRVVGTLLAGLVLMSVLLAPLTNTWLVPPLTVVAWLAFIALADRWPGTVATRIVASVVTRVVAAMLLYQAHGTLAASFFIGATTAVLVVYQDWRAIVPGAAFLLAYIPAVAALQNEGYPVYLTPSPAIQPSWLLAAGCWVLFYNLICTIWAQNLRHRTDLVVTHHAAWRASQQEMATQMNALRTSESVLTVQTEALSETTRMLEQELAERSRIAKEVAVGARMKRVILDTMGDGLVVVRADGTVLEINAAALRILGCSRDDATAGPCREFLARFGFVHPEGTPVSLDDMPSARTFRTGEEINLEVFGFTDPTRGRRWLSLTTRLLRGSDDLALDAVVVTFADMTDIRTAQDLLVDTQARKAAVLDATHDAIITFDAAGRLVESNAAASVIFGVDGRTVVGRHLADIAIAPRHRARSKAVLAEVLGTPAALPTGPIELTAMRADGREFPVEATIVQVPHTTPPLFTCFLRDISPRKAQERALEASTHRLTYALEGTSDAIWDWNIPQGAIFRSERLKDILGRRAATLAPTRDAWTALIHPDDLSRTVETIDAHLRGETPAFSAEYRVLGDDDRWAWVLDRGKVVLRDATGQPRRMTGAITGIDHRKQYEAALRAAKDAAEAASRAKSEFLARMSHELRTPLNSIIGFSSLLATNGKQRLTRGDLDFVERVTRNGTHLLGLIDQILDLAKIEAGRVTVHTGPVDIATLVHDVVSQFESQTANRPVRVVATAPATLAPIDTDEGKLRQVLINLVGNAVKFTRAGAVTVTVGMTPEGVPTRIDVADTGIGIPLHRQQAIFEPFEQVEHTTTRTYGGTGLGLAISQSLCELMGATLSLTSVEGAGSTFTIMLPATTFTPTS